MKAWCFVLLLAAAAAQSVGDPMIPDGEKATYRVTVGNKVTTMVQKVKVGTMGGQGIYTIDRFDEAMDTHTVALRSSLLSVSSKVVQRTPEATVTREARYERLNLTSVPGTVNVLDFNGIDLLIRGLSFDGKKSVGLRFAAIGAETPFRLEIQDGGADTLTLAGRTWNCRKVYLTVSGIWSAFVPKSTLWVDGNAPHLLLKFDGLNGAPGSPKRVMELIELTVEK